jgi:hypothetical protein
MDEYVLATSIRLNKSLTFCGVKPLHNTCRHFSISLLKQCGNLDRSPSTSQEKPAGDVTGGPMGADLSPLKAKISYFLPWSSM